jgi:hypothetical protein
MRPLQRDRTGRRRPGERSRFISYERQGRPVVQGERFAAEGIARPALGPCDRFLAKGAAALVPPAGFQPLLRFVQRERGRRCGACARCFTDAGVCLVSRRRREIAHRVRNRRRRSPGCVQLRLRCSAEPSRESVGRAVRSSFSCGSRWGACPGKGILGLMTEAGLLRPSEGVTCVPRSTLAGLLRMRRACTPPDSRRACHARNGIWACGRENAPEDPALASR